MRRIGTWSKHFLEWTHPYQPIAYLSIAFTWHLPRAFQRAVWLTQAGYDVVAGGPAVRLLPTYLQTVATCNPYSINALKRHNPMATVTSRGCIRQCRFCAVPRIEGGLRELPSWPILPIVCDNNLLACSRYHFDRVIDSLKPVPAIDFEQGLDCRLLTSYHASRLAELDCRVRLALDHTANEPAFMRAYQRLRAASIPKHRIRVYVLIGFEDTPEDALYRLRLVSALGIDPNPMRYNPLDAMKRDTYVAPGWTDTELSRYMRYWFRLRWFRASPFEDYDR